MNLIEKLRSLQHGRGSGIAMAVTCVVAAASLPAWTSIAVAEVRGNSSPVMVAAVAVKVGGVNGEPSSGRPSIERPGIPTCAGAANGVLTLGPLTLATGRAGQPGATVGCGGLPPNLAVVDPARFADFARHRKDVPRNQA